jgi:hypothetical protein
MRVEKTILRGALCPVTFTSYFSSDQIKKNWIDRTCGTCERQERCMQAFGGEI